MPRTEDYWDVVYSTKVPTEVSWYQPRPDVSVRLVTGVSATSDSVIDVGAGTSKLVDELLRKGYGDVTVLDASYSALNMVQRRLADGGLTATTVVTDVTRWEPSRTYDVWHDRAVFHFMDEDASRDAYVRISARAVAEGGHIVIGAFAEDGPESCSGLPVVRHSAESLASLFGRYFDLQSKDEESHRTPWDAEQPFTWVVMKRNLVPATRGDDWPLP